MGEFVEGMGSVEADSAWAGNMDEDELLVVVTGFGPFGNRWPVNPSWEVAHVLPPITTTNPSDPKIKPLKIRILVHPSPIRVSYDTVRNIVPSLWNLKSASGQVRHIDFMIHIGMASSRAFYSVERRGHRDGYVMPDVDGKACEDEERWKKEIEESSSVKTAKCVTTDDAKSATGDMGIKPMLEKWIWEGCPSALETDFDIDDVWRKWRKALPTADVRISEDPGRYLCDFIYYCSLAHLYKISKEARAVERRPSPQSITTDKSVGTESTGTTPSIASASSTSTAASDKLFVSAPGTPAGSAVTCSPLLETSLSPPEPDVLSKSITHIYGSEEPADPPLERRVVFLHIPPDSDEASIMKGKEVMLELIRALAESRAEGKRRRSDDMLV